MLLNSITTALVGASTALAGMIPHDVRSTHDSDCGSGAYPEELLSRQDELLESAQALRARDDLPTLRVYTHVLARDNTRNGGNVPLSVVFSQHAKIVLEFYGLFNLNISKPDYYIGVPENWLKGIQEPYAGFPTWKAALRKGSYKDLNLYIAPLVGNSSSYAGECDYPVAGGLAANPSDGCTIRTNTMLGYWTAEDYPDPVMLDTITQIRGQSKAAIHEIGHWLGLPHIWEAGCTGNGLNSPTTDAGFSCRAEGYSTCPNSGKPDPYQNFMSYKFDACMDRFELGQKNFMKAVYNVYRVGQY